MLKGATYHIVFSDAANYPPPFRLENLSQVTVLYMQTGTTRLTPLSPGQLVPYAWDEVTCPEKICLQPASTTKSKEFDFESFGPRGKLYYDSYFYIAAVATFPKDTGCVWQMAIWCPL